MMNIQIKHLKNCPEYLETIATWIYNEWWTDKPEMSIAKMKELLKMATSESEIPLSLIAFIDGEPVGTVNFIESDNSEFPELKPWLAALLVNPTFRKQGVGSALVNECIRCAKNLNINELYLGTDIPQYYESFGAEVFATGSKNLKIMQVKV